MRGALALVLLSACGCPDVGRTTGGPLREERLREERLREEVPRQGSATSPPDLPPRPPGRPYADSALSPFAEAMTDLALAAVTGEPRPASPVSVRGDLSRGTVTWLEGVAHPRGELVVLGLALELELVLKRGQRRPSATGAERWGSVHAVIGVTAHGLRLVELRPRRIRPRGPEGRAPVGMEGLRPIVAELSRDLRRGDISTWELGEGDRALLGNDAIWSQVREDRPRSIHLQELATMLAELPDDPLAVLLGDVAVLVVASDGRLLSLGLELLPEGDSFVLGTDPLVEVGQVWPPIASSRHRATSSTDP